MTSGYDITILLLVGMAFGLSAANLIDVLWWKRAVDNDPRSSGAVRFVAWTNIEGAIAWTGMVVIVLLQALRLAVVASLPRAGGFEFPPRIDDTTFVASVGCIVWSLVSYSNRRKLLALASQDIPIPAAPPTPAAEAHVEGGTDG